MRSDQVLNNYQEGFSRIFAQPVNSELDRVKFLRGYLCLLNEFLYERRAVGEIDQLNEPSETHPEWKRITPFLAIWDDYVEKVVGFTFDADQINRLAKVFVDIFQGSPQFRQSPIALPADKPSPKLGGLTPRQFCLIRVMHALQDFSELPLPINEDLVGKLRRAFANSVPDESVLAEEESARKLMAVLGGADRNVDERIRYIFSAARIIKGTWGTPAYGIAAQCEADAKRIYSKLVELPGLKGKKANMLLRDFYQLGIWSYGSNLSAIDIIPDNRVMRIALRTAILRPALGKLLNSLLDEFDFQYGLTATATQEAFRRVWERTKIHNGGTHVVPYPAGLDEFVFRLGDGRGGCCKPNTPSCRTNKRPPKLAKWMEDTFSYEFAGGCPFAGVCPEDTKDMQAPFAIQNMTWMGIFTGRGGGGGLRGV